MPIADKRQVVEGHLAGAARHALAKAHDVCRNLIRVRIEKHEAALALANQAPPRVRS